MSTRAPLSSLQVELNMAKPHHTSASVSFLQPILESSPTTCPWSEAPGATLSSQTSTCL